MELVDEFHEEAVIQSFHVTNTQSTTVPFLANTIPSNEATRSIAFFLPGLEKSASFSI